jgi:hypothetical protein
MQAINTTTTSQPSTQTALSTQPIEPSTITSIQCDACQQPLVGELVRALDGTFHLNCFQCLVSGMNG